MYIKWSIFRDNVVSLQHLSCFCSVFKINFMTKFSSFMTMFSVFCTKRIRLLPSVDEFKSSLLLFSIISIFIAQTASQWKVFSFLYISKQFMDFSLILYFLLHHLLYKIFGAPYNTIVNMNLFKKLKV